VKRERTGVRSRESSHPPPGDKKRKNRKKAAARWWCPEFIGARITPGTVDTSNEYCTRTRFPMFKRIKPVIVAPITLSSCNVNLLPWNHVFGKRYKDKKKIKRPARCITILSRGNITKANLWSSYRSHFNRTNLSRRKTFHRPLVRLRNDRIADTAWRKTSTTGANDDAIEQHVPTTLLN
jgi:hypothetical protein